eukprot:244684-Pelagomonas_calceolata.AAC.1
MKKKKEEEWVWLLKSNQYSIRTTRLRSFAATLSDWHKSSSKVQLTLQATRAYAHIHYPKSQTAPILVQWVARYGVLVVETRVHAAAN